MLLILVLIKSICQCAIQSTIPAIRATIRSIGDSTLKAIHEYSKKNSMNLELSSKSMIQNGLIKPKAKIGLILFLDLMMKWRNDLKVKKLNHVKLLQIILMLS